MLFIFSTVVLGLNLLMGYAGQVSLGHAGFMAIGAYAVALGPHHYGLNPWISLILGVVIVSIIAWVIGRPILRLQGYHLAMATLAFGAIVSLILNNEVDFTGGPDGMPVARINLKGLFGWSHVYSWYVLAGIMLVGTLLMLANLLGSKTGRALRAVHDSEVAASVLGIDVAKYKLRAFVISAALASLAGGCMALLDGYITPETGSILRSIELLTMVVIGGLGSLLGSVVGAGFLVLMPQMLTVFHEYEHAILGAFLIVAMVLLPRGIVPSLLRRVRGWLP
jgi:branched-chain amino acid transport system permease protein